MDNLLRLYSKEHPTLLLSVCYFIVTIIGVVYSFFFYAEFGIEILKYADLSDFLLAAILEPLSVAIFIFWLCFYIVSFKFELWARKKFNRYGRFIEKSMKPKYSDPILLCIAITVITVIYVKNLAIDNTVKIKSGEFDLYSVSIPNSLKEQPIALLGTSSRFSYFYDMEAKESIVVPIENIAFMRKKTINKSLERSEKKPEKSEKVKINEKK